MSIDERQPKIHGTRTEYQRGCRCSSCTEANADYQRGFRGRIVRGRRTLDTRIPATLTWRRLRAMIPEYGSRAQLARALGFEKGALQLHTDRVTVRNALRVWQLYRLTMLEGPDEETPVIKTVENSR